LAGLIEKLLLALKGKLTAFVIEASFPIQVKKQAGQINDRPAL
jgi:hypothetical protein